METDQNKSGGPSALAFGYEYQPGDLTSWATDGAALTAFPLTAGDSLEDSTTDYTTALPRTSISSGSPFSTTSPSDWPIFDSVSQLSPTSYPTGDALASPSTWAAETGSESGEHDLFSPVDGGPAFEGDAAASPTWLWSEPSSPSMDVELSFPTTAKSKPSPDSGTKPSPTTRTRSKPSPPPKLRIGSQRQRKSSSTKNKRISASSPSEADVENGPTADEVRVRRNHNLVEKQYRNRLNAQFERLLSVLPLDQRQLQIGKNSPRSSGGGTKRRGSSGGADSGAVVDSEDKRLSKAEVLDVATRRIKELEGERLRLMREKHDLLQSVEFMNGAMADAVSKRGLLGL